MLIVIFCFLLYTGPYFLRWFNTRSFQHKDYAELCLNDKVSLFYYDVEEFNAYILHNPPLEGEKIYKPFVGNGVFGVEIDYESPIYIKHFMTLSYPVFWHPIVNVRYESMVPKEAIVSNFLSGIVYRYQCYANGLWIAYEYYAHRTVPSIFIQDIKISNTTNQIIYLELKQLQQSKWPTAVTQTINVQHGPSETFEYKVVTGHIEDLKANSNKVVAVSVITRKINENIEVGPQSTLSLRVLTSIHYSKLISRSKYSEEKDTVENANIELLKEAIQKHLNDFKKSHVDVWNQLWSTGFYISYSKAADAVNGDKINATMYYVLSHVRSPYHEDATTLSQKTELINTLSYAEGCYGNHHTLQAVNLWGDLSTIDSINKIVSYWLLTLEKQGCHNLVKAGASGVLQAMVLSFGGFRFSNQHLEFNIHPQFLHREYLFRRLNYGNLTHVNVSVILQEDNKAILNVALDRSDKNYYACDAGCLHDAVQLGPEKVIFPVKLTKPVTPILYITSDKQHMELLRHAIHVQEVVEAPALEHHVIALHKHGHHLGGLPTLFWVSVGFLIVVFHLFLFKLIYNEYCGGQDKYRMRYGKL